MMESNDQKPEPLYKPMSFVQSIAPMGNDELPYNERDILRPSIRPVAYNTNFPPYSPIMKTVYSVPPPPPINIPFSTPPPSHVPFSTPPPSHIPFSTPPSHVPFNPQSVPPSNYMLHGAELQPGFSTMHTHLSAQTNIPLQMTRPPFESVPFTHLPPPPVGLPFPIPPNIYSTLPFQANHPYGSPALPANNYVDNFIANVERNKKHDNAELSKVTNIKIFEMKEYVLNFYTLLRHIEDCLECFSQENELNTEEWSCVLAEVNKRKEFLISHEKSLPINEEVLSNVARKIRHRAKKRKSIKKRKSECNKIDRNKFIDYYMQRAKEEHERNNQMKIMRLQADSILVDVLKKKSETNYYIQLLSSLIKLHSVRRKSKKSRGIVKSELTEDSDIVINLGKLKEIWESKLKEYTVEETGLRLMSASDESANNHTQNVNHLESQRLFRDWTVTFFGTLNQQKDIFYRNQNEFINIRRKWDQFVTVNAENSSNISVGWVIPVKPSTDKWKQYLMN